MLDYDSIYDNTVQTDVQLNVLKDVEQMGQEAITRINGYTKPVTFITPDNVTLTQQEIDAFTRESILPTDIMTYQNVYAIKYVLANNTEHKGYSICQGDFDMIKSLLIARYVTDNDDLSHQETVLKTQILTLSIMQIFAALRDYHFRSLTNRAYLHDFLNLGMKIDSIPMNKTPVYNTVWSPSSSSFNTKRKDIDYIDTVAMGTISFLFLKFTATVAYQLSKKKLAIIWGKTITRSVNLKAAPVAGSASNMGRMSQLLKSLNSKSKGTLRAVSSILLIMIVSKDFFTGYSWGTFHGTVLKIYTRHLATADDKRGMLDTISSTHETMLPHISASLIKKIYHKTLVERENSFSVAEQLFMMFSTKAFIMMPSNKLINIDAIIDQITNLSFQGKLVTDRIDMKELGKIFSKRMKVMIKYRNDMDTKVKDSEVWNTIVGAESFDSQDTLNVLRIRYMARDLMFLLLIESKEDNNVLRMVTDTLNNKNSLALAYVVTMFAEVTQ